MSALNFTAEVPVGIPILQAFRAQRISLDMPKDRGRLYIVAFRDCFKLGRSANLYGRFYEVLRRRDKGDFAYALIGPEHDQTKEIERFILSELNPWLYRNAGLQHSREYFYRSVELEALLTTWFRSGYSDVTGLKELQDARLAEPKRNRRRK